MTEIENLRDRLKNVIQGTCNTIGCKDCGLKWTKDSREECSATDLQSRLMDLEYPKCEPEVKE